MLSIQKILVLLGILWIVWKIFKLFDKRSKNIRKKNSHNVKCAECGMWINGERCENNNCSKNL